MKNKLLNYKYSSYIIVLTGLLIVLYSLSINQNNISIVNVKSSQYSKKLDYPWISIRDTGLIIYKFNYYHNIFKNSVINIIPDDKLISLKVNDNKFQLDHIPKYKLGDWKKGFYFDFNGHFKNGMNNIEIIIKNKNGIANLQLKHKDKPVKAIISVILYLLSFILIFTPLFRKFKFSKYEILIFGGWLTLVFWYLSYTEYYQRIFDVYEGGGHMDYILMIRDQFKLPNPSTGWEYHQPPLYYSIAAIISFLSEKVFRIEHTETLRVFSIFVFGLFLIYANRINQFYVKNIKLRSIIFAAIVFWPAGIIHASRIGNDILMYLWVIVGLYYLIRWWHTHSQRNLNISLIMLFLGIITKASAIILAGAIAGLFLTLMLKKDFQKVKKPIIISVITIVLAMILNLGDNIYFAMKNPNQDWLLVNVGNTINNHLRVDNNLINYLYFDFKTYATQAFTNTWLDIGGRQYFWNFLFKSSLFSEYSFMSFLHTLLAHIMSFSLVGMIVYFGFALIKKIKSKSYILLYKISPLLWFISSGIIALLSYRIKVPISCNGDFRYIYPIIVAFLITIGVLCTQKVTNSSKASNKRLPNIAKLLIFFSSLSVIFFISWGIIKP